MRDASVGALSSSGALSRRPEGDARRSDLYGDRGNNDLRLGEIGGAPFWSPGDAAAPLLRNRS